MKNVAVIPLLLWEYWVQSVSRLKTTYKEQGVNIRVQHLQKTMLLMELLKYSTQEGAWKLMMSLWFTDYKQLASSFYHQL